MRRVTIFILFLTFTAPAAEAASLQDSRPSSQMDTQQQSIRQRTMVRRIDRMRRRKDATDGPAISREPLHGPTVERPSARVRRARAEKRAIAKHLEHRRRVRRLKRVETKVEEPSTVEARFALFDAANQARLAQGLEALTTNEILETSAQGHAQDMLARDYFSHDTPEGITPKDRMMEVGYGNLSIETCHCRYFKVYYGENLAKGQKSADDVIADWLHSPDHRAVLLSPDAKETGIGIAGSLWVQHYGSIEMERQ